MVQQKRSNRRTVRSSKTTDYRPGIVTFIHILGFRDLVQRSQAKDLLNSLRFTQEFAAAKDHPVLRAGTQYKGNLTRSFAFSDSIVRVRPYDAEYNDGSLFHEIIALVHAQADLSHHGIFIRGGVAVGKIVFEKNAVFGPALVRAYDLESQYANVPRIIIGPEVFHELRRNAKLRAEHHELTHEIHYIKKLVRRGDDGLWFVDYLKAFVSEMDEPTQYPQFIRRHRNWITANANKQPLQGRTLQKYLWLAQYHNSVCGECGDAFADLAITPEQMPMMVTLPEVSKITKD